MAECFLGNEAKGRESVFLCELECVKEKRGEREMRMKEQHLNPKKDSQK